MTAAEPKLKVDQEEVVQSDKSDIENREVSVASSQQEYRFIFSASAREYFRVWIVNVFLTVITLGIYAAWAKVRTRQYFYSNTELAGHTFEYLANPKTILKGHLIIGVGFLLYFFTQKFVPGLSILLMVLFYIALPFLIFKSLRFFTRNSAYRNIRFRFVGTLRQCYEVYFFVPILVPFTFGLILPYWSFRRKEYFFNNIAFGTAASVFKGRSRSFYKYYAIVGCMFVGIFVLFAFSLGRLISTRKEFLASDPEHIKRYLYVFSIGINIVFLLILTLAQQFFYAKVFNYCWSQGRIWHVRFKATLKARKLMWIRFTNILAIVFSVGLLIPWAKVRRMSYIFDNLRIVADNDLDNFEAALSSSVDAIGESAIDFFDIDIGL